MAGLGYSLTLWQACFALPTQNMAYDPLESSVLKHPHPTTTQTTDTSQTPPPLYDRILCLNLRTLDRTAKAAALQQVQLTLPLSCHSLTPTLTPGYHALPSIW